MTTSLKPEVHFSLAFGIVSPPLSFLFSPFFFLHGRKFRGRGIDHMWEGMRYDVVSRWIYILWM